jgi:hypothetical protein
MCVISEGQTLPGAGKWGCALGRSERRGCDFERKDVEIVTEHPKKAVRLHVRVPAPSRVHPSESDLRRYGLLDTMSRKIAR